MSQGMSKDEMLLVTQQNLILSARLSELQRELDSARQTIRILETLLQDSTLSAKN